MVPQCTALLSNALKRKLEMCTGEEEEACVKVRAPCAHLQVCACVYFDRLRENVFASSIKFESESLVSVSVRG